MAGGNGGTRLTTRCEEVGRLVFVGEECSACLRGTKHAYPKLTEGVAWARTEKGGGIELVLGRAMDWQRNGVGETRTPWSGADVEGVWARITPSLACACVRDGRDGAEGGRLASSG